jgi:Acetyltransferase (GNAT) domain
MRKSIFHEDWWLDAVAPGRWREVTHLRGGRIAGTLRYYERSEAGMKISDMPPITRTLGPFLTPGYMTPEMRKTESRNRETHAIIAELLSQTSGLNHIEMMLDTQFGDLTPFLHAGYSIELHPTLLLDCTQPVKDLWAGLRDKVRNAVRRARECLTIRDIDDVAVFEHFYRKNLADETSYFDLSLLRPVLAAARARRQCRIVAAIDDNDVPHAMAVFIWDDECVYYFLSSRNKMLAHPGSVSLLIWAGMKLAHSRELRFDFDGGVEKESRYKFLVSFGGKPANRFRVLRSNSLYRTQLAFRKAPRAMFRSLSHLSVHARRMRKFLGTLSAHLIIYCSAINSTRITEYAM